MNLLFSCIGQRGYIAEYFRDCLDPSDHIIATSNTEWTAGFASCDRGVVLPDITDDGYIPAIFDLCREEEIDAILSFYDPDVAALSSQQEDFDAAGVKLVMPARPTVDACYDKLRMSTELQAAGISTPSTLANLADVHAALDRCDWRLPLFAKPRFGVGSRNSLVVDSRSAIEPTLALESDMVMQENVEGDLINLDLLGDLDGQLLSAVPWRRLRSAHGETYLAKTIQHPAAIAIGAALTELLRFVGPVDVDLVEDSSGLSVIDINPRFGGGYPCSHFAGANFPQSIVELLKGRHVQPYLGEYASGVTMMKQIVPIHHDPPSGSKSQQSR